MATFDWQAFENKIARMVASASGLPVGKVVWQGQTANRPALPYVSLFLPDAGSRLSFVTEHWTEENPDGHPGVPAGVDTITPAIDPATPVASVAVGHLIQWGEEGTTGTATLGTGGSAEVVNWTRGAAGLSFSPWPAKVHAAGAVITRDVVIGTEILDRHAVPAETTLRVQIFTSAVKGSGSAHALLVKVRNALDLEGVKLDLVTVGAVVVESGTVQNLTGLVETKIEGRASLDVRIRFTDGADESATWIESAEVTPTIDDVEGDPFNVP